MDTRMSVKERHIEPIYAFHGFSLIISAALELRGYSYGAIKARQKYFKSCINEYSAITVGSKAEGLSVHDEGDIDFMSIQYGCLCVDDASEIRDTFSPSERLLLVCETDVLYPGYARIKFHLPGLLKHMPDGSFMKQSSFKHENGHWYLSSCSLTEEVRRRISSNERDEERHGPAFTHVDRMRSVDKVIAIPYKCRRLMNEWLARPRYHGWPSQESMHALSSLDWHVVPVGPKNVDKSNELWRICFTFGEQHLVKTFDIAHLHLLVLLKFVMAKSLNPICSTFSSYTAKNLVFWLAEILAPENFKVNNLSNLLMFSLKMLREAVENGHLQNYMIPARNLLGSKMSLAEKSEILQRLDIFLDDGPAFLTKHVYFVELKETMQIVNDNPALAKELRISRDEMNELFHNSHNLKNN